MYVLGGREVVEVSPQYMCWERGRRWKYLHSVCAGREGGGGGISTVYVLGGREAVEVSPQCMCWEGGSGGGISTVCVLRAGVEVSPQCVCWERGR